MAVHGIDSHLGGIAGHLQTRHIAVGIQRQLQLALLATADVKTPDAHLGVLLAGNGIFIGVKAWICCILLLLRFQPFEEWHGILTHLRLVKTHPDELLAVCRKHHGIVMAKLLLVDPIRNTIDNLILLAILRHGNLCIVVKQLDQEDVIIPDKSYLQAVRREKGCLLGAIV